MCSHTTQYPTNTIFMLLSYQLKNKFKVSKIKTQQMWMPPSPPQHLHPTIGVPFLLEPTLLMHSGRTEVLNDHLQDQPSAND
jgi:hypothetical protein